MKIEKLEIDQLFGRFDYSIDIASSHNGISILTAPNGYGKSTILKIIQSFASGDHFYFIRERFDRIRFHLSNSLTVEIVRESEDQEKNQVTIKCGENSAKIRDPFLGPDGDDRSFVVDRALPFLTRIGPKTWRHDRTGETFDRLSILTRYGDHPELRRRIKREEWLENIRRSLAVFSIPTNRLQSSEDFDPRELPGSSNSLMVASIAKTIRDRIQNAIRHQFEEGRKKETSFPTRLIESLKYGLAPSRESVIDLIKAVQDYEERYGRLGLVPQTGTTKQLNYHAESNEAAAMLVLKTYLDDIREKFSLLDKLADQLDVFSRSINSLIAFKSIETSADEGIVMRIHGRPGETVALPALSSGEQHLIVLIGKLVFSANSGALVLIDEPEISFHPEWQEKFLGILEEIRGVNEFSALIATHSPILIDGRWDQVVELAEQYEAKKTTSKAQENQ
ncbi:AAA family ATPase [Burkholderia contaminans]|uniref:AAA family ATPase n=1 Tax=Burkholderia contaminans TaxID=488447 RepID=A0A3N8RKA2_9BURK|nr:AAA family ATPase [Burkholderia contaminans]